MKRPFLLVSCLFCSRRLESLTGRTIFSSYLANTSFFKSSSSSLFLFLDDCYSIFSSSFFFSFLTLFFHSFEALVRNSICLFFFQAVQMKSQSLPKFSSLPHCHQYRCLRTLLIKFELFPPPTQYFLLNWRPFSCEPYSIRVDGI